VQLATLAPLARAALISLALMRLLAPAHAADESELKAAIVFNVLVFIEWPDDRKTVDLCVSPDNALLPALRRLDGRELRDRTFRVQELRADSLPAACNAAFVNAADRMKYAALVKNLSDLGVFTISDDAEAPPRSTAIVMERVGARFALDVNMPAVHQARIHLSSKLLRLARAVRE
jgi:hypothetical protein